jgi:hypothetical protein
MTMDTFKKIYPLWTWWRATEKRFLPVLAGLRDQPQEIMDGLLYLDDIFERLLRQQQEH